MGNLNETIKLIRFIGVRTVGAKGGLATPPPMFLQNRHHLGIQHWGVGLAPPPHSSFNRHVAVKSRKCNW